MQFFKGKTNQYISYMLLNVTQYIYSRKILILEIPENMIFLIFQKNKDFCVQNIPKHNKTYPLFGTPDKYRGKKIDICPGYLPGIFARWIRKLDLSPRVKYGHTVYHIFDSGRKTQLSGPGNKS